MQSHYQANPAASTPTSRHEGSCLSDAPPLVDIPVLKKELAKLTPLLSGCYSDLRFDSLARMLLVRHREDYPQACRLAEIGLCLPVSTASCERGFSLQNRIKIKSRTRLLPEHLELLMKMAAGPDIECYPLVKAVTHWYGMRRRRLGRLYQPSKSKCDQTSQSTVKSTHLQYVTDPAEEQECEEELAGIDDDGEYESYFSSVQ